MGSDQSSPEDGATTAMRVWVEDHQAHGLSSLTGSWEMPGSDHVATEIGRWRAPPWTHLSSHQNDFPEVVSDKGRVQSPPGSHPHASLTGSLTAAREADKASMCVSFIA